jgi:hypothetical protein
MRALSNVSTAILLGAALLAAGCSKNASPPPEPAGGDAPPGAEIPDSPRRAKVLPLPRPSPPPPTPSPHTSSPTWAVPEGWVEEQPSSNMRRAQYRVPGPAGDGECIVFHFGQGQGGGPVANAVRWAGQFSQPDGSSSFFRLQMAPLEAAGVPVQIVEVSGTYDGGMTMTSAPAEAREDYMLLGAIAQGADGPWFFKLTGPEATVRAQHEAFVTMMESLGTGS